MFTNRLNYATSCAFVALSVAAPHGPQNSSTTDWPELGESLVQSSDGSAEVEITGQISSTASMDLADARFEVVQVDSGRSLQLGELVKLLEDARQPIADLAAKCRGVAKVHLGLVERRIVIGIVAQSFDEDLGDMLDHCSCVLAMERHVSFRYAWEGEDNEFAHLPVIWHA